MFYKQFLKITDAFNPEFVENFDFWLTTLPQKNTNIITASIVSSRLDVSYIQAEFILQFAEKEKILEKYYLIKCEKCGMVLSTVSKEEIVDYLGEKILCSDCEKEQNVTTDTVYIAYKVILKPEVSDEEIAEAIKKRISVGDNLLNFSEADSLSNNKNELYTVYYDPSESAYIKFKELRTLIDLDYGKNTTAKGNSLENLILEIFKQIKTVKLSREIKSKTNQFDCTGLCATSTTYPTVFNYLSPYFIIECKNEKRKPNNTYINKLQSILDNCDAQIGFIVARKEATRTCFQIARDHYLRKIESSKKQIVITLCDYDLDQIIDKKVNLLLYLEFKIMQLTTNSPNCKFEMFK